MLWNRRRVFFKTGEESGGTGGAGGNSGDGEKPPRKAEASAVDQLHDHEDRLHALEGGFFDRIAAALKPTPAATAPATGEVKTPPAGTKPKRVIDELGECMDPFGMFEEAPPPKAPEAPASDEAAA